MIRKGDESTKNVTTAGPVLQSRQKTDLGITPGQQIVASGTGAMITTLLVTPLDVVKIRLQAQVKPIGSGHCFLYCNGLMDHVCTCINGGSVSKQWYNRGGHFNGVLDAFLKISRTEGILKLWSGLSPTLVMAVPATVLYYTAYDQLKYSMGYKYETSSSLIPVAAGGIARVFAVSVINPLELVRTKMQSRPLTFKEIVGCIRTAVQDGGILSLWRGWGPTVLRDVPFSCLLWFNFEILRARLMRLYHLEETTFPVSFVSGAVAAGIAAFFTNPFDVVKTHRQIELGEMDALKDVKRNPASTFLIIRRIYARSGMNGLYAGFIPRLGRVVPACAIMIGSYEFGKSFFQRYNEQHQR
ncbi:mitochondrial glutathione transporter SLC25A40-like isoform X2 [Amphiura filiformis]|uniref:mitochondrial glutathione transporter SLC25A40-like isoform X2 n=1 Tax=Amphiura filiformis TaxID=82378 RepID=UPI003B2121AE